MREDALGLALAEVEAGEPVDRRSDLRPVEPLGQQVVQTRVVLARRLLRRSSRRRRSTAVGLGLLAERAALGCRGPQDLRHGPAGVLLLSRDVSRSLSQFGQLVEEAQPAETFSGRQRALARGVDVGERDEEDGDRPLGRPLLVGLDVGED
jgi:hypothetical protein